jgi:hypothetical protein
MRFPLKALLIGLAFSGTGAGSAAADCAQADIAGTWDLYITQNSFADEGDGDPDAFVSWARCPLRIAASGAIRSGASCIDAADRRIRITGGRVTLQTSCLASGEIIVRNASFKVLRNPIVQATLTPDKGLLVGVARTASGGPLVLQAVRR